MVAGIFFVLNISLFLISTVGSRSMEYTITTEWDGTKINHAPVKIKLSHTSGDNFLKATFSGPFFNDPTAPNGKVGEPFPQLWDYEVAEIFFLYDTSKEYLEVEVSPHGQHLLLLLKGVRNMIQDKLPMKYTAKIDNTEKTWSGEAEIPLSYLPKGVDKVNAYAIHGSGSGRVYEALYPATNGSYSQPDFHRLQYFGNFQVNEIFSQESDKMKIGTFWPN